MSEELCPTANHRPPGGQRGSWVGVFRSRGEGCRELREGGVFARVGSLNTEIPHNLITELSPNTKCVD